MSVNGDQKRGEEVPKFGLDFHTRVEEISHKKYASLPKKGKPESGEWTPLATIIQAVNSRAGYGMGHLVRFETQADRRSAFFFSEMEVVALGTGSKCIGQQKMSCEGETTLI